MEEKGYWQNRLTRRRLLKGAALGGAGLAAAAVIGCGGEEEAKPAATPAATRTPAAAPAAATATPAPAVKVVRGGTLATDEQADPTNLDPYIAPNFINFDYASFIYSRLWSHQVERKEGRDAKEYSKLEIFPDLAVNVEVSADLLTYKYTLRDGVKWAPGPPLNGRPLTSEDIKLSAERFMDKKTNPPQAQIFTDEIASPADVTTPDAKTVVFKLKAPNAWFTGLLAHHNYFWITPAKEQAAGLDIKKVENARGTGPFMLTRWDTNVKMTFEKNPNYYFLSIFDNQPRPYVDKVDWIFLRDAAGKLAAFKSGALDILGIRNITRDQTEEAAKSVKGFVDFVPNIGLMGINFQTAFPDFRSVARQINKFKEGFPANDVRVRKAISMALDRDELVVLTEGKGVFEGRDGWHNFISSTFKPFWLDPLGSQMAGKGMDKWFKFNPAEAKKLMEAAGFGGGAGPVPYVGSNVTHLGGPQKFAMDYYERQMNSLLGIKTTREIQDHPSQWIVRTWRGELEGIGAWTTGGKGLPWNYIRDSFSRSGYGHHGIQDDEMESLIDKIKTSPTKEGQVQAAHNFQLFMSDKMYMVPTVNVLDYNAYHPHVKNWHAESWFADGGEAYNYVWLDGKKA